MNCRIIVTNLNDVKQYCAYIIKALPPIMRLLLISNFTNLTVFMSPFVELITFLFALLNSPTFAAMIKVFFDGDVLNLELPVVEK